MMFFHCNKDWQIIVVKIIIFGSKKSIFIRLQPSANAFDDLLSAQGFSSSVAGGGMGKTMGDMRRADEIRDLTPEQIKVNLCFDS